MAHGTQRVSGAELQRRVRVVTAGAVNRSLYDLLGEAVPITPLDEGPLSESGHVVEATPELPRGQVRFSKVYAARQHEELTWKHLPGRQAKYLEIPFKRMLPRYRDFIRDAVKQAIRLST